MIIIPELKTVVILVPKCATQSVKDAVLQKYPKSFLLYRHMEANGVPVGYDRWDKVGVVRNPIERLWSLYKFIKNHDPLSYYKSSYSDEIKRNIIEKGMDFSTWILENETPFVYPYWLGDMHTTQYWDARYTTLVPAPENKKSQWIYLRPDLGTEIFKFTELYKLEERLRVDLYESRNLHATGISSTPHLTMEAYQHICKYFQWDLENS